jgi:hypothetical protein
MTPANVLFTKTDLASQVLWMCLHQWQDQYNLQEKGMTTMDMHSLQAYSRLSSACVPRRKPMYNPARKLLRRTRQETSNPVLEPQSKFPRKSILRSPANYARNMGACIPHMLPRTVAGRRKTEQ